MRITMSDNGNRPFRALMPNGFMIFNVAYLDTITGDIGVYMLAASQSAEKTEGEHAYSLSIGKSGKPHFKVVHQNIPGCRAILEGGNEVQASREYDQ